MGFIYCPDITVQLAQTDLYQRKTEKIIRYSGINFTTAFITDKRLFPGENVKAINPQPLNISTEFKPPQL